MDAALLKEIEGLRRLTVGGLKQRYSQLFGEESRSNHKQFLFRRVAWRIQANALGGLSERARRRAFEIANDSDLRIRAPKGFLDDSPDRVQRTAVTSVPNHQDQRLPIAGTLLTREFKGQSIVVRILDDGFEHEGQIYKSLSAIAQKVTGTRWNGFVFFGLNRRASAKP